MKSPASPDKSAAAPTVAILYGFCEGPHLAKRFHQQLAARGFRLINDASQADIIIGHSGGCFLLPATMRASHIVHIGIPYWPGRSLASSIWRKFISDLHSHHREGELRFWLHKTTWNLIYFWRLAANVQMLRGRARGRLWQHGAQTTVIRPTLDTLCVPTLDSLPFHTPPRHLIVPGHHDDLWRTPQPYLDGIQSAYGT